MPQLKTLLAALVLTCTSNLAFADESIRELSWSSVQLIGMHWRLVSPKAEGDSQDLYFGNGTLGVDICSQGACTDPATIWKIENNRLKIGYSPDAGDALIEITSAKVVLRRPDGKLYVYSIVPKERT